MVFGLSKAARMAATMPTLPRLQPQVQSWTSSTLDAVVWAGLFDQDVIPVMRPAAMAVPAVARARHLTVGTVAGLPLNAYRGADQVDPGPYWMQGSDGQVGDLTDEFCDRLGVESQSTHARMLWTVDDHLFYGESLWYVTGYSPAGDGRPWRMVRLPWEAWDRVYIESAFRYSFTGPDGMELDQSRCIYIPGPHEGILNFAQGTIRGATSLEQTAQDIARRPFRIELHQTTDIELTKSERAELIAATRAALADNNGILFTNTAIETRVHPIDSKELLIEGRNASALDVARDVSMPAAMIDATSVGASLEYATLAGRNNQWLDYGLRLYMDPIAARLSMDDVVPVGQRVAFDASSLTSLDQQSAGGPALTD